MTKLFETYKATHQQGFIPIFVKDDFDPIVQLEACLEARCKTIEYTLRRPDAKQMIPWIRKNYPDINLLIGSTIDDDKIIKQLKRKNPQLMTIEELADIGVDGFLSMIGWRIETINKYANTHLVIPTASTVTECLRQTTAGASFIKILGPELNLVNLARSPASHKYCPIMVTGGMTVEKIPQAIKNGAIIAGSGFDLMLKDRQRNISSKNIAKIITQSLKAVQNTRKEIYPELNDSVNMDNKSWLDALPHYHPFESTVKSK